MALTDVFEDFIAFVKDEHLKVIEVDSLILGKVEDTAWGTNDDMGSLFTLQHLLLLVKWFTSENNFGSDIWHELGQTHEFTLDLVS